MKRPMAAARYNLALPLSRLRLHAQAVFAWEALRRERIPDEWRDEVGAKSRTYAMFLTADPPRVLILSEQASVTALMRNHPQEARLAAFDAVTELAAACSLWMND